LKKFLFVASAALAAAAMAPAANASVTVACPGADATNPTSAIGTCTFTSGPTGGFTSSIFKATAFTDNFFITTGSFGDLSFTLTNTAALSGISFSSIQLFDSANTLLGNIVTGSLPTTFFSLAADTYKLVLTGATTGPATYSGTIDLAPVPEPTTWAMMVAGIAAVGMTMRRRSKNVRVAFS
jgi:hypothetical protein